MLHFKAVGLVLVLLDLAGDLCHFSPLAEVDQLLAVAFQEVRIALLRLEDVGQVDTCGGEGDVLAPSGRTKTRLGKGFAGGGRTKERHAGRVDGLEFG